MFINVSDHFDMSEIHYIKKTIVPNIWIQSRYANVEATGPAVQPPARTRAVVNKYTGFPY